MNTPCYRQQVYELMLEAWDGLEVEIRTKYLTAAATDSNSSSSKSHVRSEKTSQSQQQQQRKDAVVGSDRGSAAVSVTGQKRKATSASSSSSSSGAADDEYDHDGSGDDVEGGRAVMSRPPRGTSSLSSPHQQTFLRSPSSSDSHGQTRSSSQFGGNKDSYKPPRVGTRMLLPTMNTVIYCPCLSVCLTHTSIHNRTPSTPLPPSPSLTGWRPLPSHRHPRMFSCPASGATGAPGPGRGGGGGAGVAARGVPAGQCQP